MNVPFAAASLIGLAIATTASAQRGLGQIEEGKPFPSYVFPSLDGEPKSIADYRGRKVLLHVFASW